MEAITETFIKFMWIFIGGALALLSPTLPFVLICVFATILDCITAWRLAKRTKRHHPEIPEVQIHDKFESEKFWGVFPKLLVLYGCIVLGYMIDTWIFPFLDMYLPNFMAGAFCFRELYSILENESSENGSAWAKFLQQFMVNKAERHIEGIQELLNKKKNGEQ